MELSDIQASNGLNRRFFKGVGNSVGRNMACALDEHSYDTFRVWWSDVAGRTVPTKTYQVASRCHCREEGCQSLR